jgi:ABC-type branched-subunit amino acid transport system permease subunit
VNGRLRLTPWVGALALYALPLLLGTLGVRTATEILYFALLATAFNLLFGYAGLLSFGFNATFGVGAYVAAILITQRPDLGFWISVAAAILTGAIAGTVIGALCVRLRGGYFSLLTLAFSQFLLAIALKWRGVTHGEDGVIVPPPVASLFGIVKLRLADQATMYWFTLTVVLACVWLIWRFMRTPLGHAVVLVRENDQRAAFLGFNGYLTKLAVFTLASTIATVAGVLFVLLQGLAAPTTLGLALAGDVLFMTVLGGTGTFLGPAVGAAVYHVLQDRLSQATEHWAFYIGALYVLLVIFAPGGITGLVQRLVSGGRR